MENTNAIIYYNSMYDVKDLVRSIERVRLSELKRNWKENYRSQK